MKPIPIIIYRFFAFCLILSSCSGMTAQNRMIKASIGYPFPSSGYTFIEMYRGTWGASLGYDQIFFNKLVVGGSIQYDHFTSRYHEISDTKVAFISPAFQLGFNRQFGKIAFTPHMNVGYTFIRFSNKNHPEVKDNNKSGFSLKPVIDITCQVNRKFLFGFTVNYTTIFAGFLEDALRAEESITRYYGAGMIARMIL